MAKVFVTINPKNGERKYEVEGVGGVACDEITKVLTESNEVLEKQYTAEYEIPDTLPDFIHQEEG